MCFSALLFIRIHRRMVVELVYLQIFWINFFVLRYYISTVLIPGAVVTYGTGSKCGKYVCNHKKTDRKYN